MTHAYFNTLYDQIVRSEWRAAVIVGDMVFLHDESPECVQWCMQDVPELFRLARILVKYQDEFDKKLEAVIKHPKDKQRFKQKTLFDVVARTYDLVQFIRQIFVYCEQAKQGVIKDA